MEKRWAGGSVVTQLRGSYWLLTVSILCCGLVLSLTMAGMFSGAKPPEQHKDTHTISAAAASVLRNFALNFAAANGDSSPASVRAVATDRMSALSVADPGDVVADVNPPSYLIVMAGTFTALAKVPPGAAAPTGPVLWVVVSASDYTVEDFGLSSAVPNISPLGPVTNLDS